MCKKLLTIIFLVVMKIQFSKAIEYEVHRIVTEINPDPFWDLRVRLKRVALGTYAFNGYLFLKEDLDNNYTFEVLVYYSQQGNNQYQLSPLRLPATAFCDFLNNQYKKYFMNDLSKSSNFPYIENNNYCPLKQKNYTVTNYLFDGTTLPKFLKPGLYKLNFIFSRLSDSVKSSWFIYATVLAYHN